eukprot:m.4291 g.4291  ORF g.4291 m.4291 type:complete len:246 (-) comp6841_c0_seq2:210-947(-)
MLDKYLLQRAVFGEPAARDANRLESAIANLIEGYDLVSQDYGRVQQVERWRSSLNLAPMDREAICKAIGKEQAASDCVAYFEEASSKQPIDTGNALAIALACIMVVGILVFLGVRKFQSKILREELYSQQTHRVVEMIQKEIVARFGVDESRDEAFEQLKVLPVDVEIGAKLGEGAFGVVNRGVIFRGNQEVAVAVKRIHPSAETTQQETFIYEARLLAMLEHPNIVKLVAVQCTTKPILIITAQ